MVRQIQHPVSCPSRDEDRPGYSMLELSVVIVIIAVITGASVMMGNSMIESSRRASTNNKLDAIETALLANRIAYNRLPCPADATLVTADANYGVEAANSGTCTGGTPAANRSAAVSGVTGNVVEGAVPVKTLGLPDEFMYDGWGRKITYAVWASATGENAFLTYGISGNCGAITVDDAGGGHRTEAAVYVLAGHGPDGHGGYLPAGTRMSAGVTNTASLENCDCNSSGVAGTYDGVYVQKEATQSPSIDTDTFDDVVRFRERFQLKSPDDWYSPTGAACTPGVRLDGPNANDGIGWGRYFGDTAGDGVASGDVNGDGRQDLLLMGYRNGLGTNYLYIVFGRSGSWDTPYTVTPDGTAVARIDFANWPDGNTYAGSVASGDVNDDGIDDIVFGLVDDFPNGRAYVVLGKGSWAATMHVNALDGSNGFRLTAPAVDAMTDQYFGGAVAVGDADGDGVKDIVVGNAGHYWQGIPARGRVYVLFGGAGPKTGVGTWDSSWPASFDLAALNGTNGFYVEGNAAGTAFGWSLAFGDVNDDNRLDLVMGDANSSVNGTFGSVYVLFGKASGWAAGMTAAAVADGTVGFQVAPHWAYGGVGKSVSTGDINGDGADDIVIAHSPATGCTNYVQSVVFGHTSPWLASFDIGSLDGSDGFRIQGATECASFERVSSGAADMNDDGRADVIVSDSTASRTYVLYGKAGAWAADYDITGLGAGEGYAVTSALGGTVADFNVDGKNDMVFRHPWENPNGLATAGSVYVVYGTADGLASFDPVTDLAP